MKNKILFLLFICFTNYCCMAQWGELGGTSSLRLKAPDSLGFCEVWAMAIDDSGNVYVGGQFTNSDSEFYVAKYDKQKNIWSELGSKTSGGVPLKANNAIANLATDHYGNVYATGNFENSMGQRYLAKWDKKTNSWGNISTFSSGNILVDKSNNIYVPRLDTPSYGEYIGKWDGTKWSRYSPMIIWPNYISRMVMDDRGFVYASIGDDFIYISDGTSWVDSIYISPWLGHVSYYEGVYRMAIDPDRNIYFCNYNAMASSFGIYKVDSKSKIVSQLCSKVPTYSSLSSTSNIISITAISSSEVYIGGTGLVDTFPHLNILKWNKVTDDWNLLTDDSGVIAGYVYSILIDTTNKKNTILVAGGLYNRNVGGRDQFVAEYKQFCNAYFTLLPSSTAHTYTLTNYCFGKGKLNYKWNWGDGSPLDTGATPSHTYASAGVYQICVEITDSIGCISSFCTPANSYLAKTTGDMIFVSVVKGTTGINNIEVAQKPISIYPNPSGSIIHIVGTWNDNIANIEIVDFLGKSIINQKNVVNGNKLNTNIDLGQIPSGTYFVKIISENKVETHKIFKQ